MGINVQICWEKFANYWDVEMRLVPMEGDRFILSPEEAVARCDENTIGVVAILGSTFDGAYEPVADICAALDRFEARHRASTCPVHVDGASGAFVAPFIDEDLIWDFRLPRVASINASGHKYGLVYPGVGWIVWRDADALPEELIFWVNYLGDNMPTFALNFSRPGSQVIAQYYNFLRLGFDGYRAVQGYARSVATRLAGEIECARAVRAAHARRRAARVRVHGRAGDRQLHRVRPLQRAALARLAGAGLHVPGQPHRPRRRCASSCGAGSRTTSPTCCVSDIKRELARAGEAARPGALEPRARPDSTIERRAHDVHGLLRRGHALAAGDAAARARCARSSRGWSARPRSGSRPRSCPGVGLESTGAAFLVAALVAVLNAVLPPILAALRLPFMLVTGFLLVLARGRRCC